MKPLRPNLVGTLEARWRHARPDNAQTVRDSGTHFDNRRYQHDFL